MKRVWIAGFLLLSTLNGMALAQGAPPAATDPSTTGTVGQPGAIAAQLRTTTPLMQGWKFTFDNNLSDDDALASRATNWETVNLPHTWNADAATTGNTSPYKRGLGWYRLEFDTPAKGARKWLEFGAASLVADVWLNGHKLGQHKGGFTLFRFDVTDTLVPNGKNVLLVKVDNTAPTAADDPTDIPPLGGDFILYGGLYRHVSLVSTADAVHFELGDMGGPGVYAATTAISRDSATVNVRAKLKSDAQAGADYLVRLSLLDADSHVAQSAEESVSLDAGGRVAVSHDLQVSRPHLWHGIEDPYQYKLFAELLTQDGKAIDKVVQDFGIREMRFDPEKGFFLNGKHAALHGVATHQETYRKGWAETTSDVDEKLALVKEIGANTIRLAHYPYDQYMLEKLDRMGLIAWAELPVGIGVTTDVPVIIGQAGRSVCPHSEASRSFRASARQQLQEMIRQQFNHAAVAIWALGNETTYMHKDCAGPWPDNLTPVFRELQAAAKAEDPYRVTAYADNVTQALPPVNGNYIDLGGITDVWARNQYPLWYSGPVARLTTILDAVRGRYPDQPVGISEYGAGAALTHHTDNVLGGPPEVRNPGLPVVYQPEEYASFVHEQVYAKILSTDYLFATYVWNMFDFATGLRNEGDVQDVNTKGLVSFDRKTRKDPFYFYKANWSSDLVTYITSRRYTNRAYPIADVRVYSNADRVELSVNDRPVGAMKQEQCLLKTCVFKNVRLAQGANKVVAVGQRGDDSIKDSVDWSLNTKNINIAAGQLETGFMSGEHPDKLALDDATAPDVTGSTSASSSGELFGSDNFFIGGEGDWLVSKGLDAPLDTTAVQGTDDPQLFKNFRRGTFSYFVPLDDGDYTVTLGFLEPDKAKKIGERVFDVVANGEIELENFDVLKAAKGKYRTAIDESFSTKVADGYLKLDFTPSLGEAVVSNIRIRKR
ncbi:glycoside hydrolase family 2 TIM barrel-domain containing protein [Mycoplana dimorpha]|uniref:Beta-galactosidase n=1 Tax=Mycoplana dimorpha TaxID=28320 RepID=A0A2T5B319_MYCDI|nr:glycoside hydrolase family 2 TIM barrel-domain containing protein [Mycoplana dimorpha]PTM93350.1 beta-galactosidase [Mycoplana dimorpha]